MRPSEPTHSFSRVFRRLALPLALAMLLPAGAEARKKSETNDLKDWIKGPVRYIARSEEIKSFKGLKTVEDRALFVERFWVRRDPKPETLTNAYRQMFWERVAQANSNFIDSPRPGWMTDRGKIHILYGPPTNIKDETNLRIPGDQTGGVGVIRWEYEGRPGQREDTNPVVIVPFQRDGSGEYRLSTEPRLASVFWNPSQIADPMRAKYERFLVAHGSAPRSELSVMLDLGKMQEVPPQEQVILERVETSEAYQTHPIQVNVNRYFHPDQMKTVVAVTAGLAETSGEAKPAVIARFEPLDGANQTRLLGEDSFLHLGDGPERVAQARITLDPGNYIVTVMIADPVRVSTGMHRSDLKVLEAPKTIQFSDLSHAEAIESLKYASLATYDEPFIVGAFRVLPKFDETYRQGDAVRLFFEVYNAIPPLKVTYQLEGQESDGSWIALGRPSATETDTISQAWEQSTTPAWPVGEYRVRVEAEDSLGRLISTRARFTLEPPEGS